MRRPMRPCVHVDLQLQVGCGRVRRHVPIVTNDRVDFRLNRERVTMREGECWYLRLSDPHSVTNAGDTDRVHLVIDAIVNEWLMDLIHRSLPDEARHVPERRSE